MNEEDPSLIFWGVKPNNNELVKEFVNSKLFMF